MSEVTAKNATTEQAVDTGKKIMVMKVHSKKLDVWLLAVDHRQLMDNIETFFPHEIPFDDYSLDEVLTITFEEMTQAEIDAIPEFDGF